MADPAPPTRRQLDDLDALLQRMLALPVESAEGPPPDPEPAPEPPPPLMLEPPPGNMVLADPILAPPRPVEPRPLPLVNPVPAAVRPRPLLPRPEPKPEPPPPAPLPPGASRPRGIPLPLRPLVWCNRAFDGVALGLGGPGRWLRGPSGRALLGTLGLVFLGAAAALVVLDRIGWTW